jgi:acetolactate synthase-1/2/3 large subunit
LENEGVEWIFGIPGEESLDVVESLRRSRIKRVLTRHEQAAAFMAATHGRLTGKPGVCLTTLGPGALNLTTGAAYALLGAMPMVMVTGQKGILSRKQARFQVVDIVSTMAPLTKMAHQIVSPATIPSIVREAFRLAQQERPGPVHLELPEDIAHEETADIPLVPRCAACASRSSTHKWARARLPAGPDSTWAPPRSRNAITSRAIDRADLIISIGHDTVEKPPFIMGPGGPTVLNVGYLPATVEEVFFPDAEVVGDVGPSLALLADPSGPRRTASR